MAKKLEEMRKGIRERELQRNWKKKKKNKIKKK